MKILKINKLTGVTQEAQLLLLPIMPRLTEAKRLTLCLYLMSDLPDTRHHFTDIAENLDLLHCSYFKYDNFLPMRSTFNAETKAVNDGMMSESSRLWKNIGYRSGKWKNTDFGNKYALSLLEKHSILIQLEDEVINKDIYLPSEPKADYLDKESKYKIDPLPLPPEDDILEEEHYNLLAQVDRVIDRLPEIPVQNLPNQNTVNFTAHGSPSDVQQVIRSIMDTVKVSGVSLQINMNKSGYSITVSIPET